MKHGDWYIGSIAYAISSARGGLVKACTQRDGFITVISDTLRASTHSSVCLHQLQLYLLSQSIQPTAPSNQLQINSKSVAKI